MRDIYIYILRSGTESAEVKEARSKFTRPSNCLHQRAREKERELGSECMRHRSVLVSV